MGKARRKERDGDQNSTDTKLYLEESVLERKLPEADLKALVDLPAGLDYNEWLASHTLALFEHVNLVYGTISEFCTPSGCADMIGPGNRTYLWFDEKGKKTRVAAPQYIDYVMTFTQKTVSDESIFPTKYANEFPSSFESIARKILRLQFHVIAHLYAAHFREIALLGLHTHLNLTFAHLTALHRRFNLIDEKETDVLRDLEVALRLTDDRQATDAADGATIGNSSSATGAASTQSAAGGVGATGSGTMSSAAGGAASASTIASTTTSCYNAGVQHALVDDNNLMQSQQQHQQQQQQQPAISIGTTGGGGGGSTLIDGDAGAPPICTQPEAATKSSQNPSPFGGLGGGLLGGILGDLTTEEFSDTSRYCTSTSVPSTAHHASNAFGAPSTSNTVASSTSSSVNNGGGAGGAGAGALYFNNNNYNNHLHHLHHNVHQHHLLQQQQHHHHHHHHHQQQPHPTHAHPNHNHHPNTGLIQCNSTTASNSTTTTTTVL